MMTKDEELKMRAEQDEQWKKLVNRKWQGLTDNEKLSSIRKWAENNTMRGQELIGLCDSIEQALKEKNT
jgi:hypothetical protein